MDIVFFLHGIKIAYYILCPLFLCITRLLYLLTTIPVYLERNKTQFMKISKQNEYKSGFYYFTWELYNNMLNSCACINVR